MNNKGFTLVEALLSGAILAVVGVIMVSLLNQSFQLNNKSQLISKIKQNGQNALNTIDEVVRNSTSIACPTVAGGGDPTFLVGYSNGTYTRIILHNEVPGISNGYVSEETFIAGSVPLIYCDLASVPLTNMVKLTSDDKNTGISLTGGVFTPSSGNTITVNFDLQPSFNAAKSFDSQTSKVHFQTTLNVRNR